MSGAAAALPPPGWPVFLRREARWLGAGLLLTLFSGFGQTFFVSLSNTALKARFALEDGQIGLIYAIATLASAATLLWLGKIVDKVSTRTAACGVILGLAAACLAMAQASAVWMLLAAYFGLRLFGQGMMGHTAMTAAGRWYETQRGRAVSVIALGHPLSEAVFPSLAVAAIAAGGIALLWHGAVAALLLVALPAAFSLLRGERTPLGTAPGVGAEQTLQPVRRHWRRSEAMREPAMWLLLACTVLPAFMLTATFFHQQVLTAQQGWPLELFAAGFLAFAATQLVSGLWGGALIDRASARALLPAFLLPMAAGLALPALLGGAWAVWPMMALFGLTAGLAATIMGALWPELFGTRHLGEIRALAFSAMVAASAASPWLTGTLLDQGIAFADQMAFMGAAAVAASALLLAIRHPLDRIAAQTSPGAAGAEGGGLRRTP